MILSVRAFNPASGLYRIPIIDESETLELKSAKVVYEDLKKNIFSDFK